MSTSSLEHLVRTLGADPARPARSAARSSWPSNLDRVSVAS